MPTVSSTPQPAGTGDRTRDQIRDVATTWFAERGVRDTSVSAMARQTGMSPSTVYFHFRDKQALFVAAFDRDSDRLCDAILADVQPLASGFWEALLPAFVAALPAHPLVQRVMRGMEPGLLGRLVDGGITTRLRTALRASIVAGQHAGDIRTDLDPDTIAVALDSILTALILTMVQAGGVQYDTRAPAIRTLLAAALGTT